MLGSIVGFVWLLFELIFDELIDVMIESLLLMRLLFDKSFGETRINDSF